MVTNKIRKDFLHFFESKGHKIFPSDSLIPKQDPTLLFTSAGMNQFKDYFLGRRKDVKKAASCQKCLRTQDLEKVGKTPYHHTFFEMLGNFSFGDYFKEEAITWAWEFLTKNLNLKEKDLWVSVYSDDNQAYNIWKDKIQIPEEKILRFGPKENFWPSGALEEGPNGPCGPCSEIFFDWGEDVGCRRKECNPSCNCGRFVEVWNLVFTQFNRIRFNKTEDLPSKNIDTGMGLERISSVLQGKSTNFQIDIMKPIVDEVSTLVKLKDAILIKAISDHIRAIVFAISDGVYPSNQDRGYVIRRLLRRALWFGFSLARKKPYLYKLVPLVGEIMKEPYPEVYQKKEIISSIVLAEEERFLSTIEKGREVLFSYIDEAIQNKKRRISSEAVFKLYDTYGFPFELTESIVKDKGLNIDTQAFRKLLDRQRQVSRQKSKFQEGVFVESKIGFRYPTEFVGYENIESEAVIKAIIKDNKVLDDYQGKEKVALVLDKSPFYPTSGGQLSDKGEIKGSEKNPFLFEVEEVEKIEDTILHIGFLKEGQIYNGIKATAQVDNERRKALARAHTSTHLLQAALRKILGLHVQQQGSLVSEDYLRFDFTHFQGLTLREIDLIEDKVNSYISKDLEVKKYYLSFQEAKKQGALAFFEEKYGEKVRLVEIPLISKELCGGTHLRRTSLVFLFIITSESSVSSGVRRIEALVGKKAYRLVRQNREKIQRVSSLLKSSEENLEKNLKVFISKSKKDAKEIHTLRRRIFENLDSELILDKYSYPLGDFNIVLFESKYKDLNFLRECLDILKKKVKDKFIFLGFILEEGKLIINSSCTQDLLENGFSCKEACLRIAKQLGGSGGGREDFGFGGAKVDRSLSFERVKSVVLEVIKRMLNL